MGVITWLVAIPTIHFALERFPEKCDNCFQIVGLFLVNMG